MNERDAYYEGLCGGDESEIRRLAEFRNNWLFLGGCAVSEEVFNNSLADGRLWEILRNSEIKPIPVKEIESQRIGDGLKSDIRLIIARIVDFECRVKSPEFWSPFEKAFKVFCDATNISHVIGRFFGLW